MQKLKILGKGAAGTVYLVQLKDTSLVYAMKEVRKEDMIKRKKVCRVMTEREILASANHPFIVTMYATFQTKDRLCFIMQHCAGGEFFGVLSKQPQKRLKEQAAKFYAAEVLLAIEYLHHLGFFYRDLKPENILFTEEGHIALTDFDLSKQAQAVCPKVIEHQKTLMQKISNLMKSNTSRLENFDIVDSEPILEQETHSFVGTLEYLAPELVNGTAQSSAVDWWTFGILLFEMMTGTTPFRAGTPEEVLTKITTCENIDWPGDVGSAEARKIVKKLLRRDPSKRLGTQSGASEIKAEKWFADINFAFIRNEEPPVKPDCPPLGDLSQFDGVVFEDDDSSYQSQNPTPGENDVFANFDMRRDESQYSCAH